MLILSKLHRQGSDQAGMQLWSFIPEHVSEKTRRKTAIPRDSPTSSMVRAGTEEVDLGSSLYLSEKVVQTRTSPASQYSALTTIP